MNITLCGSANLYDSMDPIQEKLEELGHSVTHPRDSAIPFIGEEAGRDLSHKDNMSPEARKKKLTLMKSHLEAIKTCDAVLIVNLDKNDKKNYIGGNTFLEMGFAFAFDKKIFVYRPFSPSSYHDELTGMGAVVINEDLSKIS